MNKTSLPECCHAEGNSLGQLLYAIYNSAGERPGLNFRNEPCPKWGDLPADVRAKWNAVADGVRYILEGKLGGQLRNGPDAYAESSLRDFLSVLHDPPSEGPRVIVFRDELDIATLCTEIV